MQKTAISTHYCVAYAQKCVANCTATPDKLFPVLVRFSNGQPLNLPTIIHIISNKRRDEVGSAILMCTKMLFRISRPQSAVAPFLTQPSDIGEHSIQVQAPIHSHAATRERS